MVLGLSRSYLRRARNLWVTALKPKKQVNEASRWVASALGQPQCPPSNKRVIGIVAHIDAGKTTTTERMLYYAGSVQRMGNVDSGSTVMDYMPEERERGITINSASISFPWKSHQVTLIDTPGHLDFYIEVERSLHVMDGVITIIDAVVGVQPQTETVWRQANNHNLPRIIFVNKLDRDGASLSYALSTIEKRLNVKPILLYMPLVSKDTRNIGTLVDLVSLESISYDSLDVDGTDPIRTVLSDNEITPTIVAARDEIIEAVADFDEDVMESFIEGKKLSCEKLREAVRSATIERKLVPVICGTALKNRGIQPLLDSVVHYLPSPLERAAVTGRSREGADEELDLSGEGDMVALVFKVLHDVHRGRLVYFRIFSGALEKGKILFNKSKSTKERPTKLLRINADDAVEISTAEVGDIIAATGLRQTDTGDTLMTSQGKQVRLAGVKAPPGVYSAAIYAEFPSEEKRLLQSLSLLLSEDPSLSLSTDVLTNQTLLCGMGELHLETAHRRLREHFKVKCTLSDPRVAYRESIRNESVRVHSYDSTIGVQRLAADLQITCKPNGLQRNNTCIDEDFLTLPGDATDVPGNEVSEAIKAAARNALDRGPLLGMPVIGVDVKISPVRDHEVKGPRHAASCAACTSEGVMQCLEKGTGLLMEPVMKVQVELDEQLVGEVVSDISDGLKRRGTIEEISREDGKLAKIYATVPLDGMMGWSTKFRSLTKGRGSFVMEYDRYKVVDDATQKRILQNLRGF